MTVKSSFVLGNWTKNKGLSYHKVYQEFKQDWAEFLILF